MESRHARTMATLHTTSDSIQAVSFLGDALLIATSSDGCVYTWSLADTPVDDEPLGTNARWYEEFDSSPGGGRYFLERSKEGWLDVVDTMTQSVKSLTGVEFAAFESDKSIRFLRDDAQYRLSLGDFSQTRIRSAVSYWRRSPDVLLFRSDICRAR